jgi:hypothetical protein
LLPDKVTQLFEHRKEIHDNLKELLIIFRHYGRLFIGGGMYVFIPQMDGIFDAFGKIVARSVKPLVTLNPQPLEICKQKKT